MTILAAVCALSLWPLPIAVALGYTISLTSMPRHFEFTWYVLRVLGNMAIIVCVVMSLPNPFTEDGSRLREIPVVKGWSPRLAASLVVLIVLGTPGARIHSYHRWAINLLNYVGLLVFVSGLRRLVWGIVTHNIIIGTQGAVYLVLILAKSVYPRNSYAMEESVEGPGVFVAMPLSVLMMITDDKIFLEFRQWVALGVAFSLVALLQLGPALRFLRDQGLQEPDLRPLYRHWYPQL